VIRNKIEAMEPEGREFVQHLPLARDGVWQNAVESGNAVCGYQQEVLSKVEDFADFAAAEFLDARQIAGEKIHKEMMNDE
jgi:hypothetical protein